MKLAKKILLLLCSVCLVVLFIIYQSVKTQEEPVTEIITGNISDGTLWAFYSAIEVFEIEEDLLILEVNEPLYRAASLYTFGKPTDKLEVEYNLSEKTAWYQCTGKGGGGYDSLVDKESLQLLDQDVFMDTLKEEGNTTLYLALVVEDNQVIEGYIIFDKQ